MLYLAAILAFLIGIIHSVLGEKYLLIRLFRRDNLPELFGDTVFTKQTLRFAWHITTIAWWAMAALLFIIAHWGTISSRQVLIVIALSFLLSGVISLIASRAKHLSWIAFFAIAALCYLAQ